MNPSSTGGSANGPPRVSGPLTSFSNPFSPSKIGDGPVIPSRGEHRGEDALPRGVGEGDALPVRQLPDAALPQRRAGDAGDVDRVPGAARIQPHHLGAPPARVEKQP